MALPARRTRWPALWHGGWPPELWGPAGELTNLLDRMSRLFELGPERGGEGWLPVVETEESEDAYLVRAELPGMKRDDVQVELCGADLRISGEVKQEEEGRGKVLRSRHGKFSYRTSLPADADTEKIEAELSAGVLSVRLPKAAQARARRIEISG